MTTPAWVWLAVASTLASGPILTACGAQLDQGLVQDAHSDNPRVEAFYRQVEGDGMGTIHVKDAHDWAVDACGGNALKVWTATDYSMAQSFQFSTAALKVCDDMEARS